MKRVMWFVLLAAVLVLNAACSASAPAPAPQTLATQAGAPQVSATQTLLPTTATERPTAAPAQGLEPTKAPSTAAPTATNTPVPESVLKLVGTLWQWVKSTDNSGNATEVNEPNKYLLQFFIADGKLAVKADCNTTAVSFTADGHNLAIDLGPRTLAACPPGSLSDQFIKELGEVQAYLFEGDNLILGMKTGSGSMRLAKAGAVVSTPVFTGKTRIVPTLPAKPATTLDFKANLVGCRNAPTTEKPSGIILLFRFEPTGAAGPYHYFDVDNSKEVTKLYERPASKGTGVVVTWAVQSADGQRREKKSDYAASLFANFGCK